MTTDGASVWARWYTARMWSTASTMMIVASPAMSLTKHSIAVDFQKIVDDYVCSRYPAGDKGSTSKKPTIIPVKAAV